MPAKKDTQEPKKETAAEPAAEPKSSVKSNGKKILIVEDEKPLAHALQLKVAHEGYDVTVAFNGEDGLKEATTGKYDMVLLDLIMPGMDGFALMEQLKAKSVKTKIIVLSNLGQDEDRKRATDLGAVDYFVKANTPISDIITKVKSVL